MPLSGLSLNAATAVGPGTAIMFDEPRATMAQITFTNGSGSWNMSIEGTLDGVNWAIIRTFLNTTDGSYLVINNDLPPVMGVRANLTFNASGAAVVTAFLSATKF